jgi:hypothetical protein
MQNGVLTAPSLDELRENLRKDGGRTVMHGGNAYEDDLEPESGPFPSSDSKRQV